MTSTFSRRRIDLQFQLGAGDFGQAGADLVNLSGLRVAACITKAGGASMSECQLRISGMSLDVMNRLTILGAPVAQIRKNLITVSAGDDDSGMAVVFVGVITEAWVDTREAPNVHFVVTANTGLLDAFIPVAPTSYKGAVDVAVVMQGITSQMSPVRTLVNFGVTGQISNPYLAGTHWTQIQDLAQAGDFLYAVDNDTVTIWPKNGSRDEQPQKISAETGMIGYPMHTDAGVAIQTLYNPNIVFGALVEVESILTPASGFWRVMSVQHDLEAEVPGGKWFTRFETNTMAHGDRID